MGREGKVERGSGRGRKGAKWGERVGKGRGLDFDICQ